MLPAPQEIQPLLIIKKDLVISLGREFRTSAACGGAGLAPHHRDVRMWKLGSNGHRQGLWPCGKYYALGKRKNNIGI